ncbi:ankyrin [Hypoxylon sp. FL1857]|nr:ankyrin [Hypoxylon sp. FL1857]
MDTTSSLIAILQISWKVMEYIHNVKDGGKERSELTSEVLSVYEILLGMKDDFDSHDLDDGSAWSTPLKPLFEHGGTIDQVKTVLEELAAKIVVPHKTLAATGQKLKWPFEKSEVKRLLDRLRSSKDTITLALTRAHLKVGLENSDDIKYLRHALKTAELETALKWISVLDFRAAQQAGQRQRLSGTGTWFLNNPQVRGWSECRTAALWCHGLPGVGKTVLASTIFQQLHERYLDQNVAILVAYCSFDDENTHSVSNILSSFIRQIVEKRGEMSNAIKDLYAKHSQDHKQPRPDLDQLTSSLSAEIATFEKTFIIIDGLDEVPNDKDKTELLQEMESLNPLPHLMVTSRPVPSIATWFKESSSENKYRVLEESLEYDQSLYICDNCDESEIKGAPSDSSSDSSFVEINKNEATTQDDQSWRTAAAYRCENCGRDVCVNCYEKFDICFGCSEKKTSFKWAWPGSVTISAHPEDIDTYIAWRIQNSRVLRTLIENARGKASDLSFMIAARVREEAHGMFLLAKFHMNALEEQTTAREIIKALEKLPSNVKDIYDNVFKRIGNLRWAKKLEKLITIVATARRLLSTEALAHAVAVNPGDDDIDPYDLSDIEHLSSMCAGLIEIDHAGFVRLAHETVGFYIAQNGLETWGDSHGVMAEICLIYLQFRPFSSGACIGPDHKSLIDQRRREYPFLTYAATNWGFHVRETKNPKTSGLVNGFLDRQAHLAAAVQIMWIDDMETSSGWDAEVGVHGLHLVSYFGLSDAVSVLLSTGIDADIKDCLETTPLMYAAQEGHADIVHVLLHTGADAGRVCGRNRTALHRACQNSTSRHISVVREIVSSTKDVSINAFDVNNGNMTALMYAVLHNSEELVRLLLTRKDIDIELERAPYHMNALLLAVYYGQYEIVKVFLDDGRVSIESRDSSRKTALSLAALNGYSHIVELLLDRGANPDAGDRYDGPPLLRAIDHNQLECVRLLIDRGANYKFKDFLGRGVLHACAINRRSVVLRYLLKNTDLDPNIQGDSGETPLHDAVTSNSDAVARVLLEYGARTDIENKAGVTPLRLARDLKHDRLFALLTTARKRELEETNPLANSQHPARIDTLSADYKFPIHSAAQYFSREEFEKYLLDLGPQADKAINSTDSVDSGTPLHFAARFGKVDNMRLLLERGANTKLKDRWGFTPLHLAVDFGQLEAVEALLQSGCDVNEKDLLDRTPLAFATYERLFPECAFLLLRHNATFEDAEGGSLLPLLSYAVESNEIDVVKILVEGGVPFQIRDRDHLTPYQRAKRAGHQEIAQYLYDKTVGEKSSKAPNLSMDTIPGLLKAADSQSTRIVEFEKSENNNIPTEEKLAGTPELEELTTKSTALVAADERRSPLAGLLSILGLTAREFGLLTMIFLLISILLCK